ncbi:MAG TPA: enolase C-terminal domain-like protein [Xanthobacteraceae bacterium]|jgi:muconate cycloisomerase|nr:enolase C-terminal domain-like protein [Xanthobacteraceae bacterium]
MKIKRVEPIAVSFPMKKPVVMAGVEIARADNVLVRIEADNGVVGWGEAASAPTMTGETVESMMAAIGYLAPVLAGHPAEDIAGALAAMATRMYANNGAKAAIEIALHDLVGRATGRPVYALLGGKQRSRMAVLGVIGTGELNSDLREAENKKADGYVAFKIKVGIDAPGVDGERTRCLCRILGPDGLMSSDANQGWSTQQALDYVRAVADARLDFFEQPVAADDLAGMAAVAAAAGKIAIGADEGIHSLEDIRRHHSRRAARGVSLKAIKLGGMRGAVEAGRLCDELGMNVNVSAKTGESSIACAAATHIAAALPQIAWGLTLTNAGLSEDVTAQPLRIARGHVEVSDRPGLGIDVDEDSLRRFRREVPVRQVA